MNTLPDITSTVMERVAKFEKKRAGSWIRWFFTIVGMLTFLMVALFFLTFEDWSAKGTLDLFQLFIQDWEIVVEYWQDTLATILTETSLQLIAGIILVIIVGLLIVIITTRKRHIMRRRLKEASVYTVRKEKADQ